MAYLILIVSDEFALNFSRNVRLSEQNRQWVEIGHPHKKHQHHGQLLLALPWPACLPQIQGMSFSWPVHLVL